MDGFGFKVDNLCAFCVAPECAIDLGVDGAVVVTKAEDSETLTVVRILISHPSAHKF